MANDEKPSYLARVPQLPRELLDQVHARRGEPPAAVAAELERRLKLCKLAIRLARKLYVAQGGKPPGELQP